MICLAVIDNSAKKQIYCSKIVYSFTPDGIPLLCDIIKKNADKLSPMSQELMTAVRVLKMLCTEPKLIELEKNELVRQFINMLPFNTTTVHTRV
jgi:hypothetical protein